MSALSELLNQHISGSKELAKKSNRQIATDAGVSRGTVDNYRNGKHPDAPSEDVLQAFHNLLGIPLTELRTAAGVPPGEPTPYVAPAEFNRLSHAQRTALDEFIRSFVGPIGDTNAIPAASATQSPTPAKGKAEKTSDDPKNWEKLGKFSDEPPDPRSVAEGT